MVETAMAMPRLGEGSGAVAQRQEECFVMGADCL
jgi:hypothetical protein